MTVADIDDAGQAAPQEGSATSTDAPAPAQPGGSVENAVADEMPSEVPDADAVAETADTAPEPADTAPEPADTAPEPADTAPEPAGTAPEPEHRGSATADAPGAGDEPAAEIGSTGVGPADADTLEVAETAGGPGGEPAVQAVVPTSGDTPDATDVAAENEPAEQGQVTEVPAVSEPAPSVAPAEPGVTDLSTGTESAPDATAGGDETPGAVTPGAVAPGAVASGGVASGGGAGGGVAMGDVAPGSPTPGRPTHARPTPGRPTPGRPSGGPAQRPARTPAAAAPADAGSALREAMAFGRVAEDGTVFVRTAAGEREVGTWVVGETEQALAFFARRFATLETEVELAESRARAGALGADATAATAARLAEALATAQVVGDLDGLAARIAELPELALERREQRKAEKAASVAAARKAKEELVSEAEVIGQSSTWRAGPDRLRELFDIWQGLPRLDKAADDALWHRFSAARTTFTRRRKAHYSELAEKRVEVRTAKQLIIAEAEKLAESTDWGPSTAAHRDLMTRWKQVGSASKDDDDALWNRFHTARQAFFDARAAHDEIRSSGEKEALTARRAVLTEAEALLPVTDLKAARRSLRLLRERWDAVGHVPRGALTGLDARWKAVEDAVRGSEKQEWRRTDPEARRRAEQAANQLHTSIARLEGEAAAAQARGDVRAATQAREAAAARREWLVQAEKVLTESR